MRYPGILCAYIVSCERNHSQTCVIIFQQFVNIPKKRISGISVTNFWKKRTKICFCPNTILPLSAGSVSYGVVCKPLHNNTRYSVVGPDSPNRDTEPAFQMNDQNWRKKIQLKFFRYIFFIKNCNLFLGLRKGRPNYRRTSSTSKNEI